MIIWMMKIYKEDFLITLYNEIGFAGNKNCIHIFVSIFQ